jgi:hypothetical protein
MGAATDTYTIRTKEVVVAENQTRDQVLAFHAANLPAGHAVVLPAGRGIMPLSVFVMWSRSLKATDARMAAQSDA